MTGWSRAKVDAFEGAFHDFLGHVRIRSKDTKGDEAIELYGAQKRFLDGIFEGLAEDVHTFAILKARQLGISTISYLLTIFYAATFDGIQGGIGFDTDANKEKFRILLRGAIGSLPKSHRIGIQKDDRYLVQFENGSSLDFLVAGVRRSKGSAGLGRSRAFNFFHGTEISSWADMEGVRSLQASLSDVYPDRLYLWESTARGYNLWYEMWKEAKKDVTGQRAIFIGWWAKESYRIKRGTKRFELFGKAPPNDDEKERIQAVYDQYDVEIDDEQLAWYRALTPAVEAGAEHTEDLVHDDIRDQEYPWTEEDAFILSGSHFFSGEQLGRAAIEARNRKCLGYRYVMGDDFRATEVKQVLRYKDAELRVWAEPEVSGVYIVAADPAFGSSDNSDNYCCQVVRCYSDGVEQVAEYCVRDTYTYQFAWVIAQLAGWYSAEGSARLMLEINGPGEAVWNAFRELETIYVNYGWLDDTEAKGAKNMFRNVRQYLYKRKDSMGGGFAYQWKTTTDLKVKAFHQMRDQFSLGGLRVYSMELLEEMKHIVQEGSNIEASGSKHDDRVMAMAMAVRAWHDSERMALASQHRTREVELKRNTVTEQDLRETFFEGIKTSFFAQNEARRKREERIVRQSTPLELVMDRRGFLKAALWVAAAPMIVKASSLMKVRQITTNMPEWIAYDFGYPAEIHEIVLLPGQHLWVEQPNHTSCWWKIVA